MEKFDDLEYTRDQLVKKLLLIQDHSTNGSALEGCMCIPEKHLFEIEAYSEEGIPIASKEKEKEFYIKLGDVSRKVRHEIVDGTFNFPSNPFGRESLPHGLTACEKSHPDVKKKLSSCINEAEINCCGEPTSDYGGCTCNPVAVCRASISCP